MPNLANLDYVHRINRAIDHITNNLGDSLRLDDIARVACFSPFHFHRVFRSLVGETLNVFIKRVRLERAVQMMSHRDASLTDIALACGFSSSSDFSRNFRAHYGVPPSAFDVEKYRSAGREKMIEAMGERLARLPDGENPDGFVARVRDVPARRVAYLRVLKPYEGRGVLDAIEKMMTWARARGLAGGQWLGYQWEDPEIVPMEQCRYDVGLEVPAGTVVDGDINVIEFPAMKLAECEIKGTIEVEMRAIDWMYRTWLPTSGYVPDEQPCFEAWNGEPFAHGMEHFELRMQLPVIDG